MEENSNYLLGHNISCNMDMIHEFSAGVNSLFMNAQDILNEGKGILNTISGIMGSIPGEALHGGLSDSIRDCLSRMEMCDMGMEGFVLVRKANGYVDNLYGIDSSHAEKVRSCAGYFQSLIRQNMQLYMSGENGKGVLSISQSIRNLNLKGSVDRQNADNEEEELQKNLKQLERYIYGYDHVPAGDARAYYQRKMNECFNNEIRPILGEKINIAMEKTDGESDVEAINVWKEINEIVEGCRPAYKDVELYESLEGSINIIINSIKTNNNTMILREKENIRNINIELNKLHELSDEYLDWLWTAEGRGKMFPYIDEADSDNAQNKKTVTLGMGVTFNNVGNHWKELNGVLEWSNEDIMEIINTLYGGDTEKIKQIQLDYTITEEEGKELFSKVQTEYIERVNAWIDANNEQNGNITCYSQSQLEAMFDYAYNNWGQEEDANKQINDQDSMIYYYLRKDQEGGVNATIEFGTDNERRRINQMNLFYNNDYSFVDSDKPEALYPIKEKLGY